MATQRKKQRTQSERNLQFLREGRLLRTDEREIRSAFGERYYRHVLAETFGGAKKHSARRALSYGNVIGYGIGEKLAGGVLTGDVSLVVYVTEKIPEARLTRTRIPDRILGLRTDVVEIGEFRALTGPSACEQNAARRISRPFPAGVSIGAGENNAGTIGYRVARAGDPTQMILSNAHVLADLDNFAARPPVFQPGFGDKVNPETDRVGVLRGVIALRFDGRPNVMDAAVAAVTPNICLPAICGIGKLKGSADPAPMEPVLLFGKTSRGRRGFVKHLSADVTVVFGNRSARFTNQILIVRHPESPAPLADDGDSGAILIKSGPLACGLVFAGNDDGSAALATPISRILDRFNVSLVS